MKTLLAGILAASFIAAPALEWGKTGHRVTGAIAERYLSNEAREAISELIGVESLAEASTWADFMRSSPEPFWRQAGPYHYVTVPEGQNYTEVGAPEQGDAIAALEMFAEIILDESAPLEDRQRALRFTIHIIGDLHQPLHAGNGTDRGGNDFDARWYGDQTNLHSIWDTRMVDAEQLSYTEMTDWLDARITGGLAAEWMISDPVVWVTESTEIRDTIYPAGDNPNLSWEYIFEHRATMRTRLSQGGVRMAAYLNELFEAE